MIQELLGKMANGYEHWTVYGKYPALLLLSLLFLWLSKQQKGRKLWVYGGISLVCVCCPVTAYCLMKLQGNYYTYEELYTLIPMLGIIAYGFTSMLETCMEGNHKKYEKIIGFLCVVLGVLLSGTLSFAHVGVAKSENRYKIPGEELQVLQAVSAGEEGEKVRLLAPDSVLHYARAYDGALELVYGRNMEELLLNAYVYDTYDEHLYLIHRQMQGNLAEVAEVFPNEVLAQECTHVILEKIKAQGFTCDWTLLLETEHYLVYQVNG